MTAKGRQQLSKQIFYKLFSQQQKTPGRDRWINMILFSYSDSTVQETINMLAQNEAPILKAGTYRLDNFTVFRTRHSATHTQKNCLTSTVGYRFIAHIHEAYL